MSSPRADRNRFPNYEILGDLGQGAMGTVHLARDTRIGRRVALKTLKMDPSKIGDSIETKDFLERLRREAELCGMLQHPNIVTLYEAGMQGDVLTFMAFEYVEGETLKEIIRTRKPLPLEEALSYAEDVLKGLSYAHSRGVIHRDIKPANILVSIEGEAKIADFGIAKPKESNLTLAGELLGTPNYMSPEQIKGEGVSAGSDLFSLGVVLYEMLTGVKPFAAEDLTSIMYKVVNEDFKPVSQNRTDLGERFDPFVAKLLEKSRERRYGAASDVLTELRRLRHEPPAEIAGSLRDKTAVGVVAPEGPAVQESTLPNQTVMETAAPSSFWRREVTPMLALSLCIVLAGPLAVLTVFAILEYRRPPARHQGVSEPELATKKEELKHASSLFEKGDYAASAAAYGQHLEKYPESIVAGRGLDLSLKRVRLAASGQAKKVSSKKSESSPTPPAETKPKSRLDRFKEKFRRKADR